MRVVSFEVVDMDLIGLILLTLFQHKLAAFWSLLPFLYNRSVIARFPFLELNLLLIYLQLPFQSLVLSFEVCHLFIRRGSLNFFRSFGLSGIFGLSDSGWLFCHPADFLSLFLYFISKTNNFLLQTHIFGKLRSLSFLEALKISDGWGLLFFRLGKSGKSIDNLIEALAVLIFVFDNQAVIPPLPGSVIEDCVNCA